MSQMRNFLRQIPLLALALTGTVLFTAGPSATAEAGSRFAAPDGQDQGATSVFGEAKGGNGGKGGKGGGKGGNGGNGGNGGGGNGGGGNGGGGNGGGGKGGGTKDLSADVQPGVWNTNYENSEGTVSVVIRGGGLNDIDTSSIVLVGAEGTEPLSPTRIQSNKSQIRAFFAKSDAIALLETPERGETHELTVEFSVDGEEEAEDKTLTVKVRIVGSSGDDDDDDGEDDDEESELEMQVQPGTWNTNWSRSKGTVSVKITGSGLADVDLDSIVLIGTDAEAEPLSALRARHNGNHIRVYFAKSDVLEILDTPAAGETHTITLRLTGADDAESELTDTIRIVGPAQ